MKDLTVDMGDILIVDDTPANLSVLSMMLTKVGYKVRPAISGEVALRAIDADLPDLILLDVRMPDMDGFELCTHLKADPRTVDIPVIFISALSEIDDKLRAFEVGGVDYITKPFQTAEVRVRVNTHLTLAKQRQQIESINELKDQLISTVAHNLKSPISIVMMYSDMLRSARGDAVDLAEKIHQAGERMNSLTTNFLDLSKIESGIVFSRRDVSIKEILDTTLSEVSFAADYKKIAIYVHQPEESITIQTDPRYLKEALENFISNAVKYTPENGQIDITAQKTDSHVVFKIIDTGIGIPEAYHTHIFEKFYRIPEPEHQEISGTGLGLAIAYAIIKQLGGSIDVESKTGEGTTFTINLPINE